jgi:hypothetical protein
MNSKLDLMQIIKEMITEIGDLENIEPYPYSVSKISNTYDESEDTPSFTVSPTLILGKLGFKNLFSTSN